MKTFEQHLISERILVLSEASHNGGHLTHVEDLMLYKGVDGVKSAIQTFQAVVDSLDGNADKSYKTNIKFDGAPAVFTGTDPDDGKFFVAKKSIFNKVPKVYKTHQDIDDDTSGDLNAKLHIALDEFAKLGIKDILHGDFLFSANDIKTQSVDGDTMVTFQANTIVYAVPADSDLAKEIKRAKVGVIFHTVYKGATLESIAPQGTADISYLKTTPSAWVQQAYLKDFSGTATFTEKESNILKKRIAVLKQMFSRVDKATISKISSNATMSRLIEQYNNSLVRANKVITDAQQHVDDFIAWLDAKLQKDVDKLKSEKGKARKMKIKEETMAFFDDKTVGEMVEMIELQMKMVEIKSILLKHLQGVSKLSTFVRTKDGFKVTNHEGFVVYDKDENMVKLVDRLEFSRTNFNPEYLKAWDNGRG